MLQVLARLIVILISLAQFAQAAGPPPISRNQIAAWIENLSHDSAKSRAAAARALAETSSDEAVAPLIMRLLDSDADVRLNSAFALGRIAKHPEKSIAGLTRLLFDTDEHVRYSAQWSLAQVASSLERPGAAVSNLDRLDQLLVTAAATMAQTGAHQSSLERIQAAIQVLRKTPATAAHSAGSIHDLFPQLKSEDIFIQVKALDKVKRLDPAAAASLIELLAKEPNESMMSILDWNLPPALARIGQSLVPFLIPLLQGREDKQDRLVVDVLNEMPTYAKDAIPQLLAIAGDPERPEDLREKAIFTIGKIGPAASQATSALQKLVADDVEMETLRLAAVGALGQIGPGAKAAAPKLTQVLERDNEPVELRIATAQSLAQIAPTAATATILIKQAQKTDDLEFAGEIAISLAFLGENASAAVGLLSGLVEKSSADNEEVCVQAIEALGQIGLKAQSAAPALIQLLTNPEISETIHVAAAATLGKLGPPAVSALAEQLNVPEADANLTIARALAAIGPQAAPAVAKLHLALAKDDQDNDIRILAAIALGNCGPAAKIAIPALMRLLNDGEADVQLRAMCAVALGSIDPSTAQPLLTKLLLDPATSVQVAAAFSLSNISPSDRAASIQQLVDLLALEEARDLAARALIEIGKDTVSPLAASAKIEQHDLAWRLACIDVLGEIGKDAAAELIAAMNDTALADLACNGLCNIGQSTVPALLVAADDEALFNPAAREKISQLIRDLHDGLGSGDGDSAWGQAHPLARLSKDEVRRQIGALGSQSILGSGTSGSIPGGNSLSEVHNSGMGGGPGSIGGLGNRDALPGSEAPPPPPAAEVGYKSVKVFYGTNRQPVAASPLTSIRWLSFPTVAIVALAICLGCLLWQQPRSLFAVSACAIGLAVLTVPTVPFYQLQRASYFELSSVEYGGEYSDRVEMGVCEVTIPDSHEVGELEAPSIVNLEFTVDPEKHIVLRSTQRLASDAFFEELDGEMVRQGRNVLVFIHGYNVSFADAARRTAQMASDLKYPGAALFYSWPSQANWYKYRLDEKNVELSVSQLQSFLLEVAERSNATTINLVAHSMGNRALTSALKEIDATARGNDILFNQVVLAAPDIDATVFKQRIAPSIITKARRITLYASSKDLALFASRQFNSGDARAGDAGDDIVVVSGVETIDASAGDSSLLGHCYYGNSVSVLRDIEHLLKDQPPQERPFLHPRAYQGMTYWIFNPDELASQPGNSSTRR